MKLLEYCKNCKDDNERIELGYHPQNGPCKRWQCRIHDLLDTLFFLFIFAPIMIIVLPILIIIMLIVNIKVLIFG